MPDPIKIGTRGSRLALWQADWVKSQIQAMDPDLQVDLVIIKTKGDKILDVPLAKVGGKGLFVKEIEDAMLNGQIDLAVHSMKDMPAMLPKGLHIGAIPCRENPADVLISRNNIPLAELPPASRVGTSSLRRSSQLLHTRSDLVIETLRGNLDTRLKKLDAKNFDAIVLAAAGVLRMGLTQRITEYLDHAVMLPAVGQGALCIECRKADSRINTILKNLDDEKTGKVVLGERAFLNMLGGGCQVPIAAHGRLNGDVFTLTGLVATVDGKTVIKEQLSGSADDTEKVGIDLGKKMIALGADKIIENLTENSIDHEKR